MHAPYSILVTAVDKGGTGSKPVGGACRVVVTVRSTLGNMGKCHGPHLRENTLHILLT